MGKTNAAGPSYKIESALVFARENSEVNRTTKQMAVYRLRNYSSHVIGFDETKDIDIGRYCILAASGPENVPVRIQTDILALLDHLKHAYQVDIIAGDHFKRPR